MPISTTTEVASHLSVSGDVEGVPVLELTSWRDAFPGLIAGITTGGADGAFDLALWGRGATAEVLPRWESLRMGTGMDSVVHARQVHETTVRHHRESAPGLHLVPAADGHLTRAKATLLTVSVADCVPAFLIAPEAGVIGLVHAGWRSAAGGILEVALNGFRDHYGLEPDELHLHLGPSICGACYEVGPEVFAGLGEPVPTTNTPIDLPGVLARRALAAGFQEGHVSRSTHCTKCGDAGLYSHRNGQAGRQMAYLGIAR